MTDEDEHEADSSVEDSASQAGTTNNTVNADVVNGVVQAGLITGGVHNYLPAPQPPTPTPRQLLAAPADFVGRADQLAALDRALAPADGEQNRAGTAVISAIGGAGGIGKTWLALTWAHHNLDRFPNGQLSVDLRGFSPGEPRHPTDVLADFLAALGVDRDHQPTDLDARVALYRTHTAGKRLLILLDNAATTDQIEPLLPGGTTSTVLVTSRHRLPALLTRRGARPMYLDVLTDTEAHTLLYAALGSIRDRAAVEQAITELIGLCKGFPLALGLIAARIRTHPDLLDDLVADLRDLGLDALDSDDPTASLPSVLSWSLRHLAEQHRTAFALLGIAPGPEITLPAMVSLAGSSQAGARESLSVLEERPCSTGVRGAGTGCTIWSATTPPIPPKPPFLTTCVRRH
ncbi:NB-ARC domain-containing protein [Kutzneria sp. NPDC052558]|uniref:NB-ARC domain-containing protein n=1 Tax=Kutzneria sp. NPDC052558 TaxID=3364121 RepID=UPI0037CAFD16